MDNSDSAHGVIRHDNPSGRTDHLFRISLKALVFNDKDEILQVKESGRDDWDIPGGGINHGEAIKDALQRELKEEVNLTGGFDYQILSVESPKFVEPISIWQMRIIFAVWPHNTPSATGADGDEIRFTDIDTLRQSESAYERIFAKHAELAIKLRQ